MLKKLKIRPSFNPMISWSPKVKKYDYSLIMLSMSEAAMCAFASLGSFEIVL
jgi:hypothetical protein